jgi:PIN domain nuclease of toxin-antitoxin system
LALRRSLATFEAAVTEAGFETLDVTMRHAAAVAQVSTRHADPFDRLLLAQCEIETLKLLTADRNLQKLPQAVAAD